MLNLLACKFTILTFHCISVARCISAPLLSKLGHELLELCYHRGNFVECVFIKV